MPHRQSKSWWEIELQRLADDILAEPIPERLRAICTAEPSKAGAPQAGRSGMGCDDED